MTASGDPVWAYLYRALDKFGNTIDFYLSSTRNTKAAKRFLGKALNGLKDWELPVVLNTDKAPTYAGAILSGSSFAKPSSTWARTNIGAPSPEGREGSLLLLSGIFLPSIGVMIHQVSPS